MTDRPAPGGERDPLAAAVVLGAGGGLRSFAPLAVLAARGAGLFPGPARFIAYGAAIGELVADKQPDMGPRTAVRGMTLRVSMSALGGREVAGPMGGLVAGVTAAASAHLASRLRGARPGRGPALLEDAASYALVGLATRWVGTG